MMKNVTIVVLGIGLLICFDGCMPVQTNNIQQNPVLPALDSCGIITDGVGHGSCVAIGSDLVLTAAHCLKHPGMWIEINGIRYEIMEKYISKNDDIGIIRVYPHVTPLVPLTLGKMPAVSDTIYLIGAPDTSELSNNLTKGVVSKLAVTLGSWDGLISVDAASWYGNSGGPLLNAKGQVVGVLVSGIDGTSISLCEPITDVLIVLDEFGVFDCWEPY